MSKILFVCLGNSERSVIAEEIYNKYSKQKNGFSAGIKIKQKPESENMIKLMKTENINVSKKQKTRITQKYSKQFKQIYILCKKEKCYKYLQKSKKVIFWNVKDPFDKDYEFLLKTKEIIKKDLKKFNLI